MIQLRFVSILHWGEPSTKAELAQSHIKNKEERRYANQIQQKKKKTTREQESKKEEAAHTLWKQISQKKSGRVSYSESQKIEMHGQQPQLKYRKASRNKKKVLFSPSYTDAKKKTLTAGAPKRQLNKRPMKWEKVLCGWQVQCGTRKELGNGLETLVMLCVCTKSAGIQALHVLPNKQLSIARINRTAQLCINTRTCPHIHTYTRKGNPGLP